ncbi:MAG: type I polyketide synthase [Nostoc sp. ChiSLP01]|nr:type I polyketide synthase [Nostoc sp. CmiSLP01]MDZ8286533.1 type I polyketide synthase [Nostoc sp. ChiSLP01]
MTIADKNQVSSSKRLLFALDEALAKIEATERSKNEPIAVIGMGCRFPGGANNPETLWQLLCDGLDATREVPKERWDIDSHYHPDPDIPGKIYVRSAGFLSEIDQFEPQFFGISPREAASTDPQQRLLLEVCWEALERAGEAPDKLVGSHTGVFIGITANDYARLQSQALDQIDSYYITGNTLNAAAGRLSYTLGFQGPSMSIDTACSSSLVAIHQACQSLRNGECNQALAGGVNLILSPEVTVALCRTRMLSPDGRCKTFDADADGFARGEGCGILVLKRLSDAQADKNNILAIIRGSAINQDGASSGFTVPNCSAQQAVIRQALKNAKVDFSEVSYVEAHGTGTSLGDPIEVRAIAAVLGKKRSPAEPLKIGTVKTNIGHLESAAGVAGVIKTILQLQHQQIAPHPHLKQLNPHINWEELPITVPTKQTPWQATKGRRIAGVSAFGASGTNAHLILEEAPIGGDAGTRGRGDAGKEKEDKQTNGQGNKGNLLQTLSASPPLRVPASCSERPLHILSLSAKSAEALKELASKYQLHLAAHPEQSFTDTCFTANTGRSQLPHRLSIVADSGEQARDRLAAWKGGETNTTGIWQGQQPATKAKIAFLFAGQGSQCAGVGRELYATQPTFKATLDKCADILRSYLDIPLLELLWGSSSHLLDQTAYTQPAIFAVEYALYQLWQSWGIQPNAVLGHSVGEYVAACVAGVFSLEDGLKLIATRAKLMQALPSDGAMAAVLVDKSVLLQALSPYAQEVVIAAYNGPRSFTISGTVEALQAVCINLEARGGRTKRLSVSHAFHSSLMQPMLKEFEVVACQIDYHQPRIQLIANLTGQVAQREIATPEYWVKHVREAVQFEKSIQTLQQSGYELFLELSAKPTLLGMARQCLPENSAVWLPSLHPGQSDWYSILPSLAQLYTHGVAVDWLGFDCDYTRAKVVLPTYPWQRQRCWTKSTPASAKSSLQKLHPLLDKQLRSPLSKDIFFESRFSTKLLPFLGDHLVYDEVVVPGACHLSLLLAAAKNTFKHSGCTLENVVFPQALAIAQDGERIVQLALSAEDVNFAFKLISFEPEEADNWAVHATGKVTAAVGESTIVSRFEVESRCTQELASIQLYEALKERNIDLGTSFRWLNSIHLGEREALGCLKVPATILDAVEYELHPTLIDSCFQLFFAITPIEGEETFIPFSLEKFQFYQRPEGELLWCHAKLRSLDAIAADQVIGDLQLFDQSGQLIAEVTGFEGRKANRQAVLRNFQSETANWLYQVRWQPQELPTSSKHLQPGSWLLFGHDYEEALNLAQQLRQQGQHSIIATVGTSYKQLSQEIYQVNPTQPEDFQQLLQDSLSQQPPLRGVVYLETFTIPEDVSLNALREAQTKSYASALHLVQALVQTPELESPRLWLVTRGTQNLSKNPEPLQVSQAALWGLGRVINHEHPELACTCVDLGAEANIEILLSELSSPDSENQISYHQGVRHVARLGRYRAASENKNFQVVKDGSYLITGGLGALGLETAKWLAQQGAEHLILVGRNQPSAVAQDSITQLENAGVRVYVVTADISDVTAASRVFEFIRSSLPPLRGVIHSAGVVDDGALRQLSWERFNRVLEPKIAGAWNLHYLTQDLPLDLFVCYSSIASLIGTPGQGSYAVANAFMDALVCHRQADGLPGLSINWGPWAEVGMAVRLENRSQSKILAQGISGIVPEKGLQVLGELLGQTAYQVGVLPINWNRFFEQSSFGIGEQFFEAFATKVEQPEAEEFDILQQLKGAPINEQRALLTTHVCNQVAKVIALDPSQINPQQGFFDLGMDSLTSVELKQRLQKSLGCQIPDTFVFNYPTIEAVVGYIAEKVLETEIASAVSETTTNDENSLVEFSASLEELSEAEIAELLTLKLEALD